VIAREDPRALLRGLIASSVSQRPNVDVDAWLMACSTTKP
jgi:hypothetical protein